MLSIDVLTTLYPLNLTNPRSTMLLSLIARASVTVLLGYVTAAQALTLFPGEQRTEMRDGREAWVTGGKTTVARDSVFFGMCPTCHPTRITCIPCGPLWLNQMTAPVSVTIVPFTARGKRIVCTEELVMKSVAF